MEVLNVDTCIFCEIITGRLPGSFVYRDQTCAAFMDLQPVNPGHLLVIPNQHSASLAEMDLDTGAHIFKVAQELAAAVRKSGLRCEGLNLFLADGELAGQEVFHVHLHVLPRFGGDGFGFRFGPGYPVVREREVLDRDAGLIRAVLKNQ
jgi:histidine triad (HIT) family protein